MTGRDRMLAWVRTLPDQLRAAASLPGVADVRPLTSKPAQVVLCGMGGSAAAGDLLPRHWGGRPLPWFVHRDEGLPPWVGPATLVIASSYSGETEETLAAVAEARRRGCPLAALTSGGRLADLARGAFPGAVLLPGGQPPRTALGYSFGALLHLLHRLGLADDPTTGLAAAARHLEAAELATCDGAAAGPAAAAELAGAIGSRFVVIYTAGGEAHPAGPRLKAQLNENAKVPALVVEFPELTHNDIVGWELPAERRHDFALLVLRGADESERSRRRVEATLALLGEQFGVVRQIISRGPDPLSRTLGLIMFGDYLSVELARCRDVDPVPIERINALKLKLVQE